MNVFVQKYIIIQMYITIYKVKNLKTLQMNDEYMCGPKNK